MTEQESRIALKEKLAEIGAAIRLQEGGRVRQDEGSSILKIFQEYLECFGGNTRYKQPLTPVKEQLTNQDLKAVAIALIETKNLLKESQDRAGRVEILKKAEEKLVKIDKNLGLPSYEQVVAAMKAEEAQSLPTYDEAVQKAQSIVVQKLRVRAGASDVTSTGRVSPAPTPPAASQNNSGRSSPAR